MNEPNEEARNLRDVITRLWWKCEAALEEIRHKFKVNMTNGTLPASSSSTRCTDNSTSGTDHAHVNHIQIGLGKELVAVVLLLAVVIGICGAIMGLNLSKQDRQDQSYQDLKTQYWLLERRLMDKEALDIINGTRLPSDTEFGPTGNLERMKPKGKR